MIGFLVLYKGAQMKISHGRISLRSIFNALKQRLHLSPIKIPAIMNVPRFDQVPINVLAAALLNRAGFQFQGGSYQNVGLIANPHTTSLAQPFQLLAPQPTLQGVNFGVPSAPQGPHLLRQETSQETALRHSHILKTYTDKLENLSRGKSQESTSAIKKKKDEENMNRKGRKRSYPPDVAETSNKRSRPYEVPPTGYQNRPRSGDSNSVKGIRPHEYDEITKVMMGYYNGKLQPQSLYEQKLKLRDALYSVFKNVFPYCGLYIVGSSLSGFGSKKSDMDLCLMITHCDINQKTEATDILRILRQALRKCKFLRDVQLITAKVPILKFTDKYSEVECDLNINNAVGIRNTHLLNCYAKMDSRLSPLILFVKHWAKTQNINDARVGTITSYSLVLMVVHYLQYACSPPVLPSLQQMYPDKFSSNMDIRGLTLNENLPPYHSQNTLVLGELFVGFLKYYAEDFDFQSQAISIRLGQVISKDRAMMQNPMRNPPGQWKHLCIEEPFDLSNTARSVYDEDTFIRIKRVLRRSYSRVRMSGDVNEIIENPM